MKTASGKSSSAARFILLTLAISAPFGAAGVTEVLAAPASASARGAESAPATASPLSHQFGGQALGPDLKPVPGAKVAMVASPAESEAATGGGLERVLRRRGSESEELGKRSFYTATADEEGKFTVKLPGPGPYNLRVEAEGLASAIVERVSASVAGQKGPAPSPVKLERGVPLTGKVFDLSRKTPVVGAKVRVRAAVDRAFSDPDDQDRFCQLASVQTDGTFAFRNLAANFYDLEVTAPGFSLALVPKVSAEAARKDPVLVYLEPGFSVSGRVVDREGKGIAGTTVTVLRDLPVRFSLSSFKALQSLRAKTDGEGRFKLSGLPQVGRINLLVTLEDGSRGRLPLPDPAGHAVLPDVEILLDRPAKIAGKLADAGGQPVRRASLTVSYSDEKRTGRVPDFTRSAESLKIGPQGEFTVDKVPPGGCSIVIEPEGYRKHEIETARLEPGATLDLGTIALERGKTIRGRVTDGEGKGVAKAEIVAFAFVPGKLSRVNGTTEAGGTYLLGGLDDQRYSVSARLDGYGEEQKQQVAADSEGVDFVLRKAGTIAGRVVSGPNSAPVANFTAQAHPKDTSSDMRFMAMLGGDSRPVNDPRGRFTLSGLAPGQYSVEINSPGFATFLKEGVTVPEGGTADAGDIALNAGATVKGRVVDRDGGPVPGATVKRRAGGLFSFSLGLNEQVALTGLDGRFILKGLPPGSTTIVAEHPDFAKAEATTRAEAGPEGEDVLLTLGKGGRITGTVREADGSPVSGTMVMATVLSDPLGRMPAQTDDQGNYVIDNLPPATYTVMKLPASAGGRVVMGVGMESRQADVKEGETVTVNFGEEKKIRVYGTVRKSAGPFVGARLIWVPSRFGGGMPGSLQTATADAGGNYEVQLPQAGKYSVRVSGEGDALTGGAGLEIEIPEGAEVKKDIVLPEGAISGNVLSAADNHPIEGARIMAVRLEDEDKGSGDGEEKKPSPAPGRGLGASRIAGSATSDSTGAYRVENLAPGSYKLSASKEGFADDTVDKVSLSGEGASYANFLLGTGRRIQTRVLDADGRPLDRAMVLLLDSQGHPIASDRGRMTGVDGLATVDGVREGSYGLLALARDLAPGVVQNVEVPREADGVAELRLPAGGSLQVKLVDAEGKPVAGASISLVDPSGVDLSPVMPVLRMVNGLPTTTASDGTLTFPHLFPGRHRVSAGLESGATAEGSAEVVEGKPATVTLRLK